jgi:diguanylate cyclase (GGDEF)-like protein/PAS domain S-box-containing protein
MALITAIITILVGSVIWWLLHRQLRPMFATVEALSRRTGKDKALPTLALTGTNEIDRLIGSFNALLSDLSDNEKETGRFKTIADNAVYGMALSNLDGTLVYVNHFFAEIHGYDTAELIGKPISLFHTKAQLESVEKNLQSMRQHGHFAPCEIWHVDRHGKEFPMLMSGITLVDDDGKPEYLAASAVDITERKKADAEIHRLAYYDPLTQLPNRRLFQDRLSQAMAGCRRSGQHAALIFLDIDDFKTLNDTRGHDVGDRLLVEIGQRIRNEARETDTVARLGGDEFLLMLENLGDSAEQAALIARTVSEKLRQALSCAYEMDGGEYHCSASLGIALFNGTDGSVETLLKQADLAMYRAKDSGRNTVRFFDPAMQTALDERIALETDLRSALSLNQLALYFQPQVDLSGKTLGAEVLLRWIHPTRGMVSPADFIPLAEATGMILRIGQWVLESACRQLSLWSCNETTRHLCLAVNVSAREFRKADFVNQVKAVLTATGADPSRLKLELTESMVLDDVSGTFEKMQSLKQLGIGFALDDFGTGHSSLSYLTRLPLDTLKIDSSFVFNLPDSHNDAVVAQTIISMATSLGLNVVAEGVETEAQLQFLSRHQCRIYQGYLFSRPVPLETFENFVAQPF